MSIPEKIVLGLIFAFFACAGIAEVGLMLSVFFP